MIAEVDGLNLGQGICDMPVPDAIKEATHAAVDADRSIYSPYNGVASLRAAIADKMASYNGIDVQDDEVVVSVGSTGAFVVAVLATLNPGDEIILFEPFYGYHRNLLMAMGVHPRYVRLSGPGWRVDPDLVRRAITPSTRAILINTPGNPSGKVWSEQELLLVMEIMEEYDLRAITDEVYEYMLYDGRRHVSLATLPDAFERTITLCSFSKTYNMTGWRLGYAVASRPVAEKMGLLNDLFYICAPTPLQHGVLAGLQLGEEYLRRMRSAYSEKRALLCDTLRQCGFDAPYPEGAYYAFVSFERLSKTRSGFGDCDEACQTIIREARVGSVAGTSFFSEAEDGHFFLRFCFAKEMPALRQACDQLLTAFGSQPD